MRSVVLCTLLSFAAASMCFAAGGESEQRSGDSSPGDGATLFDDALRVPAEGFERAERTREFVFPADHGPHPGFRTEWWYFTGNLASEAGRRFGFQLTFFRFALGPAAPVRASAWAANQVYMAHFAITDGEESRFFAFERFSRPVLGMAGARARPFRAWLWDWSAASTGEGFTPLRLRAAEDGVALDLDLGKGKPLVLQGDRGLSRKSEEAGNASYYYSVTRMPARGFVRVGGREHRVQGLAWLDREWSTSALAADQVGWDWFALQLSDGRELMYYQLRGHGGLRHPYSAGSLIDKAGNVRALRAEEVELAVLDHWRSPRGDARYPSRWRLQVPSESLVLNVAPLIADQEINLSVRYWEGAVDVAGHAAGRPVDGSGYVELTGYADERPGRRRNAGARLPE